LHQHGVGASRKVVTNAARRQWGTNLTLLDPGEVFLPAEVDGDDRIGLAEAISILRKTAELQ